MIKDCGYNNPYANSLKMTYDAIAVAQICMLRKGFKYDSNKALYCYQNDPRTKIPQACYEATDVIPEWWVDMSKRKWYQ